MPGIYEKWSTRLCVVLIGLTGLVMTYRAVTGSWYVDADLVDVAVLRDGIAEHGIRFLRHWSYTTDNWLLSLLPIYSLIYAVAGESPTLLVVLGWCVFVTCVTLTGVLAYQLTGRRAATLLFVALLCPNYLVIGPAGLLGHPITHNSTMAWCLIAWMLTFSSVKKRQLSCMTAACFIGLIAGLSDPWAMAVLIVPALLTSLFFSTTLSSERAFYRQLSGLWIITFLLVRYRLLGALSFLPPYSPPLPDVRYMAVNTAWVVKSISVMFSISPLKDPESNVSLVIALISTLIILGLSLARLSMKWKTINDERRWITLCFTLSLAGTVGGSVLGPTPAGFSALHLLINHYFLIPLMVFLAIAWNPAEWFRRLVIAWAVVVVFAGLINLGSALHTIEQGDTSPVRAVKPLTDLLEHEHLRYGYGTYWGAQANAVTWYSRGKVIIRPVRFDPATGKITVQHEQSSDLWTKPSDIPSGVSEFFLIVGDDGEVCPMPERCEASAIAQWGEPARRIRSSGLRGDFTILVWPHRLFSPATLAATPGS